jgi:Fe-S oxidoreductase
MKILLVSANTLKIPYPVYPLGLDYVAGALDSRHQSKIVDMNEFASPAELGAVLKDYSPDFVGVSIRNIDNTDTINSRDFLTEYKDLVRLIRENSQALLILGGSGFTIFPREFMQALDADYGIAGEGEKLPLLLQALENNADVRSLPGIVTKETTSIVYEPWEKEIKRHFDPLSSHTNFYLAKGGMLNLQTKRGCPFHCSYCTYPHIEGSRMRFFRRAKLRKKQGICRMRGLNIFSSPIRPSTPVTITAARSPKPSSAPALRCPGEGFLLPSPRRRIISRLLPKPG